MTRQDQYTPQRPERQISPPRRAARLLARLGRYDEEYAVRGDLDEEFAERFRDSGRRRAVRWYRKQAFFALASYLRISVRSGADMLKNFVKIAFRNMARYKLYSLINLAGLAVGLALGLFVVLYARYELSYDGAHDRPGDIYRVISRQIGNVYQGTDWWAVSPAVLAGAMKSEFPDVELACRVTSRGGVFRNGDKLFRESRIFFVDPDFLKIFRVPILDGAPADTLREPFTIWLTMNSARKYFGRENPVGKTLLYDNRFPFRVAGVIANSPEPSHLRFDFVASLTSMPEIYGGEFGREYLSRTLSLDFTTYVRLRQGADPAALEGQLLELAKRYDDPGFRQNRYALQPLGKIHLFSRYNFDLAEKNGDIRTVYLLSAIGLVILLVACFNFVNLFTARSATRAKEIGVRKVLGSERRGLRLQFFSEAFLFTGLASIAAVLLVRLLLPLFNALAGTDIDFAMLVRPGMLLAGSAIILCVAILSGAYPAFVLSSWSPVPILKGAAPSGGGKSSRLRNAMVCAQFAASIALLASTFIILAQMKFIREKDLGFSKDQIITLRVSEPSLVQNAEAFREEALKNPGVLDLTGSDVLPSYIGGGGPKKMEDNRELVFYRARGDYRFLDVYGMTLAQGRNFSPEHPADKADSVIINEAAVRALGWKDPIGRLLLTDGQPNRARVIGVVRDFNYHPLNLPVMPLWIRYSASLNRYFSVRISSANIPATLKHLESVWKKLSPDYPFEYSFMDERIGRMYDAERRFSKMFVAFSVLATFLACLGLVGLSTFTAERRMKEIGIRRVLGASVPGVATVLARGFLKWVAVAALAAFPIAYLAGNSWLGKFSYRIDLGWMPFLTALGVVLALAFVSVIVQSWRASTADPVRCLRNE
ncbi:MAG: ABC transporter permease [Candidatus Aminicenantes bacterium]|nr:ABC transporter permease [Candidatus Aminicenantes bacterium]